MREIDKFCKGVRMFTKALPVLMERFRLVAKLWSLGYLRLVTIDNANGGYQS